MFKFIVLCFTIQGCFLSARSQNSNTNPSANAWADSVLKSLTPDERIAQLMVLRLSAYDSKNKKPIYYDSLVTAMVKQYNIGGICPFQGNPVELATIINNLQSLAKTPLLVCIDAEWGIGMRLFDSVQALPHQMMLGAVQDSNLVYKYGQLVAAQCKRLGIQVNYAPVVDINNNPANPVINDRSFGEDKYKVARYGIQYMKGLQDAGIMACAKHFPGHGDVAVDSHFDLPVINKTMAQLDSLELYPFKKIFDAGIASVMIAHLYIPVVDSTPNQATSVSKKNVTGLLRNELGYKGLSFTDALEMQGVQKYFPGGAASAQSLIAGNDMLCLPGDVEQAITKIKDAIKNKLLSWEDVNQRCKKVLLAKYQYTGTKVQLVSLENITADLNAGVPAMKRLVAENAITVLNKNENSAQPHTATDEIAYVGIGLSSDNVFADRMRKDYNAGVFNFNYKQDAGRILSTVELIKKRYKKVIIGIHAYNRTPAKNFGISSYAIDLVNQLEQNTNAITVVFGNPYAIKNFCGAKNLIACYEDDPITQAAAADFLQGKFTATGTLPVTVCDQYKFGSGIANAGFRLPKVKTTELGFDRQTLDEIDSIAGDAIDKGATPGCVVLVVKDGAIAFNKAYGYLDADKKEKVTTNSVYDMASVTKICATTIAVMKLYDEGKLELKKTLGDYLSIAKGTNKAPLTIENILLHQAGLIAFIPFYREVIDTTTGIPSPKVFAAVPNDTFNIRVAENLYEVKGWPDTLMQEILKSPLGAAGKYVYSDNDFIFLGKIVEQITGMPLNKYVQKEFYQPLGLTTAGFKPRQTMPLSNIAATETEPIFRRQRIRGDVHDPGAAMFGGVAGHAGLFSNAYDIAVIMQMLMNGGTFNGRRYLQKETIDLFNEYHSSISRRGFGFDKPEKDNATRKEPYPAKSVSPLTFGHTGFTGTCTWADPANKLVFVFLSNRVCPNGTNPLLGKLNVRPSIHETLYRALEAAKK